MAALVDGVANATLDKILGEAAPGGVLPATVYWGLLLAEPNNDGSGVIEPGGGVGYARIPRVNDAIEWPAATGRAKVHANDIVFGPAAGGNWGLITHVGGFDALSGGTLRIFGALNTPRNVFDTDIYRFLAAFSPITISIP